MPNATNFELRPNQSVKPETLTGFPDEPVYDDSEHNRVDDSGENDPSGVLPARALTDKPGNRKR